jgi:HK97 gp10 family phage protein
MGIEARFTSQMSKVIDDMEKAQKERLTKACLAVQKVAFEKLASPGKGRWYRVPGTKRRYQASEPGDPPAIRTGVLRKTLHYAIAETDGEMEGMVGSSQKYAPMLEFGTSTMSPRPWLRPSFEEAGVSVKAIMSTRWIE